MVLRDDVHQQLVLALGQLDEGTDAVNVGVGLHVQRVVSPWGDSSAPELLVWGLPLSLLGGRGSPQLLACSPGWQQMGGGGGLFWQKAERILAGLTASKEKNRAAIQPLSWLQFQLCQTVFMSQSIRY